MITKSKDIQTQLELLERLLFHELIIQEIESRLKTFRRAEEPALLVAYWPYISLLDLCRLAKLESFMRPGFIGHFRDPETRTYALSGIRFYERDFPDKVREKMAIDGYTPLNEGELIHLYLQYPRLLANHRLGALGAQMMWSKDERPADEKIPVIYLGQQKIELNWQILFGPTDILLPAYKEIISPPLLWERKSQ